MKIKKKLLPLIETQQQISELLYKELDYTYCDNCKFANLTEEEANKLYGHYGCSYCHRKYMGWEISKTQCDSLARKIGEINNV